MIYAVRNKNHEPYGTICFVIRDGSTSNIKISYRHSTYNIKFSLLLSFSTSHCFQLLTLSFFFFYQVLFHLTHDIPLVPSLVTVLRHSNRSSRVICRIFKCFGTPSLSLLFRQKELCRVPSRRSIVLVGYVSVPP